MDITWFRHFVTICSCPTWRQTMGQAWTDKQVILKSTTVHFFYCCPEPWRCCGMFCQMQATMWWASIPTVMIKETPCTTGKLTFSLPLNTVNWWSRLCYVSFDPNLADIQGWFYMLFNSKIFEKDGIAMQNIGIWIDPAYQKHKGL